MIEGGRRGKGARVGKGEEYVGRIERDNQFQVLSSP